MPTYEYACKSCGQHVDVVRAISDEPLTVCPSCGGQLRKVFHPGGILLKGSGFYKTDNRPKKKSAEPSPSKDTSPSSSKDLSSSKDPSSSSAKSGSSSSSSKEKSGSSSSSSKEKSA